MTLILAPEERLRPAAAALVAPPTTGRRVGDRRDRPLTTQLPPHARRPAGVSGAYSGARLLQRALAEFLARSDRP